MLARENQLWLLRWWLLLLLFSGVVFSGVVEPQNEDGSEDELYCPQTPVGHCLAKRELAYGEKPKWAVSRADEWVCLAEESDRNPIGKGVQVPPVPWGSRFGDERRQALLESSYAAKHCNKWIEPVTLAKDPTQFSWMFLTLLLGMGPVSIGLAELQRIHLTKAEQRKRHTSLVASPPDGDRGGTTADFPQGQSSAQPDVKKERVAYYDFWRCICVGLAVYTHSDEAHVRNNTMLTQQWVMPMLSMIAGRLFAKSRATTMYYTSRLLFYFSVGCLFNWLASLSQGDPWWTSFHVYVAFQMPYVLLLAGFGFVTTPVKLHLQKGMGASRRRALATISIYSTLVAALVALQFCLWTFGKVWIFEASPKLDQVIRCSAITCGGSLIVSLWVFGTLQADREPKGLVGWVHFAWIYFWRIAHAEVRPGSEFHLGDLYIWASVIELEPLAGRKELGKFILEWWAACIVVVGIQTIPGFEGRHDQYPWPSAVDRFRQYLPEACAMLAFVTIPEVSIKEGAIGIPEAFKANMSWVSNWSLFTFLIHKAVYKLLPQPYAIIAVFATGIIPYVSNVRRLAHKKAHAQEKEAERLRGELEARQQADSSSFMRATTGATDSTIEMMPFTGSESETSTMNSGKQRLLV